MNIETLYKKLKYEEDHYRFDIEENLYKPIYSMLDLNPMLNSYTFLMSNGTQGKDSPLTEKYYKNFFKSVSIKNGFILTTFQFSVMNAQMEEMKNMSLKLIDIIDSEIQR